MADDALQGAAMQSSMSIDELIAAWRDEVEAAANARGGESAEEAVVAVISDVHGVTTALDAVLRSARQHGATQVWCLGDVVGRGPSPDTCLDRLHALGPVLLPVWLLGNHEALWLGLPCSPMNEAGSDAVQAIQKHRRVLKHLTVTGDPPRFGAWSWQTHAVFRPVSGAVMAFAVHGGAPSPRESEVDVYTEGLGGVMALRQFGIEQARAARRDSDSSEAAVPTVIVAGHTHRVDAWVWQHGDERPERVDASPRSSTKLEGDCLYLNVGSAGGWRGKGSPPSVKPTYGLLRFTRDGVAWQVVEVPVNLGLEHDRMARLGYPPGLIAMLPSGGSSGGLA
jgi:hypothetical protein